MAPPATTATVTGRLLAIVRIATGLLFGWAFIDKLFGLGYATLSANAWISGGSPTEGFLGNLDHGPLQSMFTSWAGAAWLFMLGLASIAIALLTGVCLRIAAVSGTIMMLLMWAAEWPLDRHTATGELTPLHQPDHRLSHRLRAPADRTRYSVRGQPSGVGQALGEPRVRAPQPLADVIARQ